MKFNRRWFLKDVLATAAYTGLQPHLSVLPGRRIWHSNEWRIGAERPILNMQDPTVKGLISIALDTARRGGAEYADARMVQTRSRQYDVTRFMIAEKETMAVSVRVLINGRWGHAAGVIWSEDSVAQLTRDAMDHVSNSRKSDAGSVRLSSEPAGIVGDWSTPIEIDPFDVSPEEIFDYLISILTYLKRKAQSEKGNVQLKFDVTTTAFGSTAGTYVTQTSRAQYPAISGELRNGMVLDLRDSYTPTAAGWEVLKNNRVYDVIDREIETLNEWAKLPQKPIEVGRYTTLLDAATMAHVISGGVGEATELDRILGYEANAEGMSYLQDPETNLLTQQIADSKVTITANRSLPGQMATVGWDADGVKPVPFTIIQNGIWTDVSTTRETAGWLATFNRSHNRPERSNGCAAVATDGMSLPLSRVPNLALVPDPEGKSVEQLQESIETGLMFRHLDPRFDFQRGGGITRSYAIGTDCFQIRNGKRVARLVPSAILFKSSELLKNIIALGGPASVGEYGIPTSKGEPRQIHYHTATSVPAVIRDVTVIDPRRRA